MGDGCSFLPDLLGVVAQGGLEELGAVPDVEEFRADLDVDGAAGAVLANGDLLPCHADDADGGDPAGDPVVPGPVDPVQGRVVGSAARTGDI